MDENRIRELVAEGKPASVIAEELSVTRQHVYKFCRNRGIKLPRYHDTQRSRSFIPRIVTGGIPQTQNSTRCGYIAELLVAADLLARGYKVYMPIERQRGHDIIAYRNNSGGILYSFEVRSASRDANTLVYSKSSDHRKPDFYALVLRGEPVVYVPDIDMPLADAVAD